MDQNYEEKFSESILNDIKFIKGNSSENIWDMSKIGKNGKKKVGYGWTLSPPILIRNCHFRFDNKKLATSTDQKLCTLKIYTEYVSNIISYTIYDAKVPQFFECCSVSRDIVL